MCANTNSGYRVRPIIMIRRLNIARRKNTNWCSKNIELRIFKNEHIFYFTLNRLRSTMFGYVSNEYAAHINVWCMHQPIDAWTITCYYYSCLNVDAVKSVLEFIIPVKYIFEVSIHSRWLKIHWRENNSKDAYAFQWSMTTPFLLLLLLECAMRIHGQSASYRRMFFSYTPLLYSTFARLIIRLIGHLQLRIEF